MSIADEEYSAVHAEYHCESMDNDDDDVSYREELYQRLKAVQIFSNFSCNHDKN